MVHFQMRAARYTQTARWPVVLVGMNQHLLGIVLALCVMCSPTSLF